jgi:hypothetical protein
VKKLLLLYAFGLFTTWLSANPVYMPSIFLESLSFDADGRWTISLFIQDTPDSVMIASSSGRAFYKGPVSEKWTVTTDSLSDDVLIDPQGDSVTIISYFMSWENAQDSLTETIIFGDYPGSVVPKPNQGEYIARILPFIMGTDYHCLGTPGSFAGILHGKIFDKENNPVQSGSFSLSPFPVYTWCPEEVVSTDGFDVQGDGSFTIWMWAIKYAINTISICRYELDPICAGKIYWTTGTLQIDSLQFDMHPDSSVEMNIHLLEDISGIRGEKRSPDNVLNIYPNPAFHGCFHYEIGIPVKSGKCCFVLFDSQGRSVWTNPVPGNAGDIDLPSGISGGIYFLQVRMNERSLASTPVIVE